MMYEVYEVTLKGFDGNDDATDDLVKWVKAPSKVALVKFLELIGLTPDLLYEPPQLLEGRNHLTAIDGVDVVITEAGLIDKDGYYCNKWAAEAKGFYRPIKAKSTEDQ